jgi:hypothetical protein
MGEAEDAIRLQEAARDKANQVERARQRKVLNDEFQRLLPVVVDNLRRHNWNVAVGIIGPHHFQLNGEARVGWPLSSRTTGGECGVDQHTYLLADGTFTFGQQDSEATPITLENCDRYQLFALKQLAAYPKPYSDVEMHEWLFARGIVKHRNSWDY